MVIIKNVSQGSRDWIVLAQTLENGSTREMYRRVALNQITAINTTSTTQITANFRHNGFHLTDNSGHINTLNEVYVYMAFAEMPEIFGRAPFDTNMAV